LADSAAPRRLATLTTSSYAVTQMEFAADGAVLAVAGGPSEDAIGAVDLWDVADPAAPHRLTTRTDHPDIVTDIAVTPDGTKLAAAGLDGTVVLWESPNQPRHAATSSPAPTLSIKRTQ
jgi:WD40 repeat protein